MTQSTHKIFNENKWREAIRTQRKNLGIPNAETFVDLYNYKTNDTMKKNTYYKIEQGGQSTSLQQFFGINLTLFGNIMPPKKIINTCLTETAINEMYPNELRILSDNKDLKKGF